MMDSRAGRHRYVIRECLSDRWQKTTFARHASVRKFGLISPDDRTSSIDMGGARAGRAHCRAADGGAVGRTVDHAIIHDRPGVA